jgi:segregation and condensation protein B
MNDDTDDNIELLTATDAQPEDNAAPFAAPAPSNVEKQPVEPERLKRIIEGALLAVGKPLPLERLESLFQEHERPEREDFEAAFAAIAADCAERGFELKKVASGYRFQVKQELSEWIARLWEEKPQRYSRALMETLSIIAYRQPITRGDIEKIRGVAVSTQIVQTLLEHEWIRVVGHRDVPGRPAMYATTKQFLDYFNLESLDQLPPLSEIRDLEEINRELSLDETKPASRIIEFPDPEPSDESEEEDEETAAAAAIGLRPISEILEEVDARLTRREDNDLAPGLEEDVADLDSTDQNFVDEVGVVEIIVDEVAVDEVVELEGVMDEGSESELFKDDTEGETVNDEDARDESNTSEHFTDEDATDTEPPKS